MESTDKLLKILGIVALCLVIIGGVLMVWKLAEERYEELERETELKELEKQREQERIQQEQEKLQWERELQRQREQERVRQEQERIARERELERQREQERIQQEQERLQREKLIQSNVTYITGCVRKYERKNPDIKACSELLVPPKVDIVITDEHILRYHLNNLSRTLAPDHCIRSFIRRTLNACDN